MPNPNPAPDRLRQIKTFPSLVKYLRDELEWPIDSDDFDELTFDYEPEELGLEATAAVKIKQIKQLRPLADNQPWGIFFINFEPKRLPVVVLRRVLRSLVVKKRTFADHAHQPAWKRHDLLFISSYGEEGDRHITFAHFADPPETQTSDLPILKVLGWDECDTPLHLDDAHQTLKEKLRWPDDGRDPDRWRSTWASAFTLRHREVIDTSKKLAFRLAKLAKRIRARVNEVLEVESERGPLRKLMAAFKQALVHDLEEDDFADMYAQTIAYGLLSARVSRPAGIVAENIADMVPITNPFLKELLETFLVVGGRKNGNSRRPGVDFDELGTNDVVDLLRAANMEAVLRDFGKRNPREDPVIHFYESFLKEYDAAQRLRRGEFYTPKPVVKFIVRSVDELLRTEFGLEDGLADTTTWAEMAKRHTDLKIPSGVPPNAPFVQILDPATGTGTFLVEVIDIIYETMTKKWKDAGHLELEFSKLWNEYVPEHLLPRLYGFQLLMAPYAIAHMKLGLELGQTGYTFRSDQRARIYLTNTLEEPQDFSDRLEFDAPALAHEARAANTVKRSVPITVVIGNPPYSGISANMNPWINGLLKGQIPNGPKVRSYYQVDGKPLGEKKLWLQDDYVKFIRYGQWRIDNTKYGVLGYITNHGYLDNPTFRGMRQQLMDTFPSVAVLDLHGNAKKKEVAPDGSKDVNVFDIEQGVAIGLFRRSPTPDKGKVQHADVWGSREFKYEFLLRNTATTPGLKPLAPNSPYYFFVPRDETHREEYESGLKITDLMPMYSTGIATARDAFVFDFDHHHLLERIASLRDKTIPDSEIRTKYFSGKGSSKYPDGDTRGWKLPAARERVRGDKHWKDRTASCLYRPFDVRSLYYVAWMVDWPRPEIMRNMLAGENIALLTSRMTKGESFAHAQVTRIISEVICMSPKTSNNAFLFPLYVYPDPQRDGKTFSDGARRHVNIHADFSEALCDLLQLTWVDDGQGNLTSGGVIGPEDVLHYIYGQFHSEAYRDRYTEFLGVDFPRVFVTENLDLFRSLCQLGADLIALHLLEDDYEAASWNQPRRRKGPLTKPITKFVGKGGTEIGKAQPKCDSGMQRVTINAGSYFEGVSDDVWNFHVGGYHVCHKWLKDRGPKKGNPGRVLTDEDIDHYQKIVVALSETIRIMAEIDETINEHGGWPDAFVTGKTTAKKKRK